MPRQQPEILSYRTDRVRASMTRWAATVRDLPVSQYIDFRMAEVVDRDLKLDAKPEESDK